VTINCGPVRPINYRNGFLKHFCVLRVINTLGSKEFYEYQPEEGLLFTSTIEGFNRATDLTKILSPTLVRLEEPTVHVRESSNGGLNIGREISIDLSALWAVHALEEQRREPLLVERIFLLRLLVLLVEPPDEALPVSNPALLLEVVEEHQPVESRVRVPIGILDLQSLTAKLLTERIEGALVVLVEILGNGLDSERLVDAFCQPSLAGIHTRQRVSDGAVGLAFTERVPAQHWTTSRDVVGALLVGSDEVPDVLVWRVEYSQEGTIDGPATRSIRPGEALDSVPFRSSSQLLQFDVDHPEVPRFGEEPSSVSTSCVRPLVNRDILPRSVPKGRRRLIEVEDLNEEILEELSCCLSGRAVITLEHIQREILI